MIHELKLPDTGMGITEGTIVKWLKSVGDSVVVGEIIGEVETAKATVEIEAVAAGTIEQLVVSEGKTVDVETTIALIRVVS